MARYASSHRGWRCLCAAACVPHRLVFRGPHADYQPRLLSSGGYSYQQQLSGPGCDEQSYCSMARHHAGLCAHPASGSEVCVYGDSLFPANRTGIVCDENGGIGGSGHQVDDSSQGGCEAGGMGFAFVCDGGDRGWSEGLSLYGWFQPQQVAGE